jgi:FHA domain
VLARHPVWRWPSRVGRGYEMDVILDDPFVASAHLEIREAPNGNFAVADLQSVNGMMVLPSRNKRSSAEIGAEDVVRIGHTQLRIRPRLFKVAAERPVRQSRADRRAAIFLALIIALSATFAWSAFVTTSQRDQNVIVAVIVLLLFAATSVWIGIWSLVSRTVGGRANFAAHGIVACAGLLALEFWNTGAQYLAFGFDAGWLESLGVAGAAGIVAVMIYRHLRLASRATWRVRAAVAAGVSIIAFGGGVLLTNLTEAMNLGVQSYSENLKAPFFVMISGITPAAFLDGAGSLKRKVDAMATE